MSLGDGSPAVGRGLAQLEVRGLTGASVLALTRDGDAAGTLLVGASGQRTTITRR